MKQLITHFAALAIMLIGSMMTCHASETGFGAANGVPMPAPEASPAVVQVNDTIKLTLWFRLNKTNIDSTYRDNAHRLADFDRQMQHVTARDIKEIETITISGTASPEGPYNHNMDLGRLRATAIRDYIVKKYGFDSSTFVINSLCENWQGLRDTVEVSDCPHKAEVLEILKGDLSKVNATKSASLKRRLMALDRGKVWQYMLRNYYPALRLSYNNFVIRYTISDEVVKEIEPDTLEKMELPPIVVEDTIPSIDVAPEVPEMEVFSVPDSIYRKRIDNVILPRREMFSVKTNLLFDFAYIPGYDRFCPIPNVAIEFYPLHGHFTVGASFDCPWWQHYYQHKYFQIRNYQVHGRYYFRNGDIDVRKPGEGAAYKGFYLSAYAHAGLYSICFGEKRGWEGEGWGVGAGLGYVLGLGKKEHWRLEFGLQGGFFSTKYDPYQWLCPIDPETDKQVYYYKWYGNASDFKRRQYRYRWLGPTRIEVTLSYDLLYRRVNKKGVSFRNYENATVETFEAISPIISTNNNK